jgi:type IV pilus assembly protein PilA
MLEMLRKRLSRDEEGFTLIELMVVVLIIAILIAIAIPTFLGARERAQDRAAQSDIRNAFTAEKVYYTDEQEYTAVTADLVAIEPSLTFVTATTPDDTGVAVNVDGTSGVLYLGLKSASGSCFYLKDTPTGTSAGTEYAKADTCGDMTGSVSWTTKW